MSASGAAETIQAGTVLADTYRVTRLLGKGGMGAVWEAVHLRLQNKRVAIKVLHSDVARDADSVIRFRREANIASQLGHANIVQVFDIKELPDGSQYIVLEYLEGEALCDRMQRGPMTPEVAMPIVRQVGSALQAAHDSGIVHRDLKPGNVMLVPTEFGGYATELAKVLDFGISKMQDSSTLKTQTATVLGTPQYMAPEQALGEHHKVDARTDIFALGCIVYEMLTGTMAFQGSTIPEVMFKLVYQEPTPLCELAPHVPENIARAVHQAMAKQPEGRFTDMSAFIEALTGDPLITLRSGAAVAALPGKPPPPSIAQPHARARSQEAFAETMPPQAMSGAALADTAAVAGAIQPVTASSAGPSTSAQAPARRSFLPWAIATIAVVAAAVVITLLVVGKSSGSGDREQASTAIPATTPSTGNTPATATQQADNQTEQGSAGTTKDATGSEDTGNKDTGSEDTGSEDTGNKDSGSKDSGSKDTGNKDTGNKDTGNKDTGNKDTGNKDSGSKDTGSKDSGSKDTGDARLPRLDPKAKEKLELAQERFDAGKYADAIRAARDSIGFQDTNRARSLIARAYCAKRDLSNARGSLRAVKGRERTRVIRYCKKEFSVDLN